MLCFLRNLSIRESHSLSRDLSVVNTVRFVAVVHIMFFPLNLKFARSAFTSSGFKLKFPLFNTLQIELLDRERVILKERGVFLPLIML